PFGACYPFLAPPHRPEVRHARDRLAVFAGVPGLPVVVAGRARRRNRAGGPIGFHSGRNPSVEGRNLAPALLILLPLQQRFHLRFDDRAGSKRLADRATIQQFTNTVHRLAAHSHCRSDPPQVRLLMGSESEGVVTLAAARPPVKRTTNS